MSYDNISIVMYGVSLSDDDRLKISNVRSEIPKLMFKSDLNKFGLACTGDSRVELTDVVYGYCLSILEDDIDISEINFDFDKDYINYVIRQFCNDVGIEYTKPKIYHCKYLI